MNIRQYLRLSVDRVSERFNSLSIRVRRIILTIGALSVAIICGLIAFEQMLSGEPQWLQPTPITTPINIYPNSVTRNVQTPDAHDKVDGQTKTK